MTIPPLPSLSSTWLGCIQQRASTLLPGIVTFVALPGTTAPETIRKALSDFLAPASHRLVGDEDAALSQKQLDVPQAKAEQMIQLYRTADDVRRELMAVVGIRWRFDFMPPVSPALGRRARAGDRDNALVLHSLVGDLHRLAVYPSLGFHIAQEFPHREIEARWSGRAIAVGSFLAKHYCLDG